MLYWSREWKSVHSPRLKRAHLRKETRHEARRWTTRKGRRPYPDLGSRGWLRRLFILAHAHTKWLAFMAEWSVGTFHGVPCGNTLEAKRPSRCTTEHQRVVSQSHSSLPQSSTECQFKTIVFI